MKEWPEHLFKGNATSWIKEKALKSCKGKGIDVGAGNWCLPGAIPVDVVTKDKIDDFKEGSLDFVYSSHCLEHIKDWQEILGTWISLIKTGGILFLYLPHPEGPWNPERGYKAHEWQPEPGVIINFLKTKNISVLESTTEPDYGYSFHVIGKKI